MTPIRNDPGRIRSPHANDGPAHPKSPPLGKEGRNMVTDRPTNCTVSQAGVRGRDERGRLFGPVCSCHNIGSHDISFMYISCCINYWQFRKRRGVPNSLGSLGDVRFPGGMAYSLGNLAWGCQIPWGAKFTVTPVNYASGYDPTPQIRSGYILCMLTLDLYILGHSDSPVMPPLQSRSVILRWFDPTQLQQW